MESYKRLLLNNKAWAEDTVSRDPEFFHRLENVQRPEFLWIGCSDSRVPANEITGTQPGGTLEVSPPASTAPKVRKQSPIPRYKSSTQINSVSAHKTTVTKKRSGFPPIAAKSETTRAAAFHPTARAGVSGRKCTRPTKASVFNNCSVSWPGPGSITAQSSPGPAAGCPSCGTRLTSRAINASSPISRRVVTARVLTEWRGSGRRVVRAPSHC